MYIKKGKTLLQIFGRWRFTPLACLVACLVGLAGCTSPQEAKTSATFAMDAMISQTAYGPRAEEAMQQLNIQLAAFDKRLSMFDEGSDIARINAAAGGAGVAVAPETAALLRHTIDFAQTTQNSFAVTIAPITQAWGITSDAPRVVPQQELDALLPLVDDTQVLIQGDVVTLPKQGMGIDLGGAAKGAAVDIARQTYDEYGIESALLSLGSSTIYARGTKPGGEAFRIGFRDPKGAETAYIASFALTDEIVAVSGGYERYFEQDGQRYIHIMDPRTGKPVESDIASLAVLWHDGTQADILSTSLFVLGRDETLNHMRGGGRVVMLDDTGTLYVSESLRDTFTLTKDAQEVYPVRYVQGG